MIVLPLRMTDDRLRRLIAVAAADSAQIIFSKHALLRMRQRRILLTQVQYVLQRGNVSESAHQDLTGHWKCTLQAKVAGDLVRVAAALMEDEAKNTVIVITVMN